MKITKEESLELFQLLSERVNQPLDGRGLQDISELFDGGVGSRFLADKYRDTKKGVEEITFGGDKLNLILKKLDFESIHAFRLYLQNPIDPILKSYQGVWVSLVRQNSHEGLLYKSPVHILERNRKMIFQLRGPSYLYSGKLSYANDCLMTLFTSANNKQFHHIYKVGSRLAPKILQGTYSGISTANDPIGGRTVLYKSDRSFDDIPNEILKIANLKSSSDEFDRALADYFSTFEQNNLRINPIVSFDVEDLRG